MWRWVKRLLLFWVGLVVALVLLGLAYHQFAPVFGGKPDTRSRAKMAASPQYQAPIFINLVPTQVSTRSESSLSLWDSILAFALPPTNKNPDKPLPSMSLQGQPLIEGSAVWLGHSTLLFVMNGLRIMTDPVFYRASPLPIGGVPFEQAHPIRIADLPAIDLVLISHDHYDHLDYQAIQEMAPRVGRFLVPLGIKAHLQRWGVSEAKIVEMDWYEEVQSEGVRVVFTPARHFSGRGLFDRFATLWGSWVVQSASTAYYFSGDGGYSPSFAKIGETYGPFDMAFIEDGAYNQDWNQIHLYPEEAVQAAIDLKAQVLLPIHWAKFDLALHGWTDPIERITAEAKRRDVTVATPLIGQVFHYQSIPKTTWWR